MKYDGLQVNGRFASEARVDADLNLQLWGTSGRGTQGKNSEDGPEDRNARLGKWFDRGRTPEMEQ